jgi:hypothetical protein
MNKDLKALKNYTTERNNQKELSNVDKRFIDTKIESLQEHLNYLEMKVQAAEQREKLGIEKQKEFGSSQTAVEEARHANIMDEIQAMKEAGIVQLNRSSYPNYPRFKTPRHHPHKHLENKKKGFIDESEKTTELEGNTKK